VMPALRLGTLILANLLGWLPLAMTSGN
jgi:hypothetical protein